MCEDCGLYWRRYAIIPNGKPEFVTRASQKPAAVIQPAKRQRLAINQAQPVPTARPSRAVPTKAIERHKKIKENLCVCCQTRRSEPLLSCQQCSLPVHARQ